MLRYFQISCHALMISAFFALALTGRLDPPAILIFTLGLAISGYRAVRGLPAVLSARTVFFLSVVYIFFFAVDIVAVSGSFVSACIHLVLFLQLVKLYQEKTDRDYFYLIVLSFLQILAASSLTVDMSFVATLFLFLVALVSTLMSFDMYRSEQKGAAEARTVAMPISGMSLWATVWIILMGMILFLIIPRVGTGYFTRAASQSLLVSGFTDSVQLGEIGQVKLSDSVVMHARHISGTPLAVVKWRGVSLDRFDGRNWSKTDRRRFPMHPTVDQQYPIHPIIQTRDTVRYEILLEPLATNALFAPYQVRRVIGGLQEIEYDNDDSIYLRFPTPRRVQYQVVSEIPLRTPVPAEAAANEEMPPDVFRRYLQLPRDMDPRVEQLAKDITAKGRNTFEKALLVEGYLKRNYAYTLNLTWSPGAQPVATFLFSSKAGHCEYFASAMAILLRAAGIPTRLINGFMMGEFNPVANDYIIRESDAHSWIEAYIPGRGWTEFDPTPPDGNHVEINLARQFSHYIDAMGLFWNSYVLVYDSGAQLQLFRSAQDRMQSAQTTLRDKSDRWLTQGERLSDLLSRAVTRLLASVVFWIVVAFILLGTIAFKHRRVLKTQLEIWSIRRGRNGVSDDVVEELFYRAARLAERTTKKRRPAETWREWIFALPDTHCRSILEKALIVFERSKYGAMPVSNGDFICLENVIKELKQLPS